MQIRAIAVAAGLTVALGACQNTKEKQTHNDTRGTTQTSAPGLAPQSESELSTPLAKIDDVTITVGEFQERINRQSPHIRTRYTSQEQKKEFLDSLVRFEVLAKEAHARGFDKDPDVIRTMKQVMIQKLMKDQFETKLSPDAITDAEMKKYFEDHKNEYNKPEEVRASAIILKSKRQADNVAEKALGDEGKTNKGFRELVSKHSTDEKTKIRGGDLRYFSRGAKEIPGPVIEAAFGLTKTGDVAGPIKAGNGQFYVIKQTGKRKAITKTFDQVKRQIKNRLYREQRTNSQKVFIESLKEKANVEIFNDNLSKVRIDTSKAVSDGHGHGDMGTDDEGAGGHGTLPAMVPENPGGTGDEE